MRAWIAVRRAVGIALAAISFAAGCDQAPAPPAAPKTTTPAATPADPSNKPTTQELMSGTYRRLNLPGMSLTMMVPQSWKIEMHNGGLTFLEGPTLADQVAIQLSVREALPKDRYSALVERLAKDDSAGQDSGALKKSEVRDVGMMKIVERISTAKPISIGRVGARGLPEVDGQGNQIIDTSTPMRWLLTIFIPDGQQMAHYELNFIGMTAEQYATDKPLLDKVIGSIRYDDGSFVPSPNAPGI